MNEMTLYFRQASLRLFIKPSSDKPDSENISILRQQCLVMKENAEIGVANGRLCWACLGLLTYGFKDVLYDAVDNLRSAEEVHGVYTKLSGQVLVELLPLPEELKDPLGIIVRRDRVQLKMWISEHYDYLVWDNDEGKFNLSPKEI